MQGRFKAARKSTVVPGVESTKRSFLGQNSGPASWPDCNRYMEAVIIRLCQIYPSPVKKNGNTTLRWTLVGNAYKRIRETVLNNAYVMQQTSIQLAEINQRTLIQWYNKRSKKQEQETLKQGITLPIPVDSQSSPLPPPRNLSHSLDTGDQEKHQYVLPANTAGQSKLRSILILPNPVPLPPQPLMPVAPYAQLQASAIPPIPASTQSYRKRKDEEEKLSVVPTKRYKPREGFSKCSKCQSDRTPATGHKQYFGNWFCPNTSTETYEQWRARLAEKKYKKKNVNKD